MGSYFKTIGAYKINHWTMIKTGIAYVVLMFIIKTSNGSTTPANGDLTQSPTPAPSLRKSKSISSIARVIPAQKQKVAVNPQEMTDGPTSASIHEPQTTTMPTSNAIETTAATTAFTGLAASLRTSSWTCKNDKHNFCISVIRTTPDIGLGSTIHVTTVASVSSCMSLCCPGECLAFSYNSNGTCVIYDDVNPTELVYQDDWNYYIFV